MPIESRSFVACCIPSVFSIKIDRIWLNFDISNKKKSTLHPFFFSVLFLFISALSGRETRSKRRHLLLLLLASLKFHCFHSSALLLRAMSLVNLMQVQRRCSMWWIAKTSSHCRFQTVEGMRAVVKSVQIMMTVNLSQFERVRVTGTMLIVPVSVRQFVLHAVSHFRGVVVVLWKHLLDERLDVVGVR